MSRLQAGQRHSVRFSLNGKPCTGEAEPRLLLTDFLRHQIGATGTHVGCEHGVCGACTVSIDGRPARACLTLAVQIDGSESGPWRAWRRRRTGSAFCNRHSSEITRCSAAFAPPES